MTYQALGCGKPSAGRNGAQMVVINKNGGGERSRSPDKCPEVVDNQNLDEQSKILCGMNNHQV